MQSLVSEVLQIDASVPGGRLLRLQQHTEDWKKRCFGFACCRRRNQKNIFTLKYLRNRFLLRLSRLWETFLFNEPSNWLNKHPKNAFRFLQSA